NHKKMIIDILRDRWISLKQQETKYGTPNSRLNNRPESRKVIASDGDQNIFGMCPVASDRTVCCNLMTIDAVQGCGLGCSYCSIQTFYTDGKIVVEKNLTEKLKAIPLNPDKNYHIGSGQSSDSLAIGNRNGVLDAQLDFARSNSNIILEFKTKSKNIEYLLKTDVPHNVFVSWSLNPQLFIEQEEHGTASMTQRLAAARALADKGIIVGFHFHPIVHYQGWEKDYHDLIHKVLTGFSPYEVGIVSMGTLTFIKPLIRKLRMTGIKSKVLQIPMDDASGKRSYPKSTKKMIFQFVWDEFSPWHNKVFFYMCMEERELWEAVFGNCYENNVEFEGALYQHVSSKMLSVE
ncbi:MAG: hypothetical protein CMG33_03615, partial [Candidatus Marinimicrobia bacterium]|nr:hypothetical protein [Candidatus Neomarinimicrobiota bacterium]